MLKIEGCVEALCSYLLRAFPLHSWKRAPRVEVGVHASSETRILLVVAVWSLHAGVPSCSLAAQRECAQGGWSCRSIPPRRPCAEAPSCWMCRTATCLPHCTRTHTARGALVAPSRVRTAVIRRLSYYVRLARLQSRVWATRTEPAERWREPLARSQRRRPNRLSTLCISAGVLHMYVRALHSPHTLRGPRGAGSGNVKNATNSRPFPPLQSPRAVPLSNAPYRSIRHHVDARRRQAHGLVALGRVRGPDRRASPSAGLPFSFRSEARQQAPLRRDDCFAPDAQP